LTNFFRVLLRRPSRNRLNHAAEDYRRIVRNKLKEHPSNSALALAQAIGAGDMETFHSQGDGHVAVLRHHGLADGMSLYDLGCGCGRTAQALQRSGWQGEYIGADVVPELLDELKRHCPDYKVVLHCEPSIAAADSSLDIVFHWSVFTHLFPAECYLYLQDAFRVVKPGGRMVFSFLEMEEPLHDRVWRVNVDQLVRGRRAAQLDQFLHRDWIRRFAQDAGFAEPRFTGGGDDAKHPAFWQSLAILDKPA
jgi:ubiquinone/menaquinone biosynthesis C-methylase UbiE